MERRQGLPGELGRDRPWETTEDKREKQMEEDESFRIGGQQPRSQIPQ